MEAIDGLVRRRSRSGRAILRLADWSHKAQQPVLESVPESDRSGLLTKKASRKVNNGIELWRATGGKRASHEIRAAKEIIRD